MPKPVTEMYPAGRVKPGGFSQNSIISKSIVVVGILGILVFVGSLLLLDEDINWIMKCGSRLSLICTPRVDYSVAPVEENGEVALPEKTPYWHSRQSHDDAGLPITIGPDGQIFRNVSSVAWAITDRGNDYGLATGCAPLEMTPLAQAALEWIVHNGRDIGDATIWTYNYDTQVNDVLVKAGWPSAFAQAAIINRLLMAYCTTKEKRYLDLARRGGKALLLPVSKGGLRSQDNRFVWFQEIPIDDQYAPFILNAHLYSIFSLLALDRMSPGQGFGVEALKGLRSLEQALPTIDNGYWNRYDLRPRYMAIDFLIQTADSKPLSAGLKVGDAISTINLETGDRQPTGNAAWSSNIKEDPGAREPATEFKFILPSLRNFEPVILAQPARLLVRCKGCGERVTAYSYGIRPGLNEWYRLTELKRTREGDNETIEFSSGLSDYSWGQVAPEYIPFHASLMAVIARMTQRPDYLVYAYRWQNFYRNWLHDKDIPSTAPVFRERFPSRSVGQLGSYLAEHFRYELPSAVSQSELITAIDSMSGDASVEKTAIYKMLALPAREF